MGWDDRQPVFRPIRHAWRVEVAHGRLGRTCRLAKSFENTTISATGCLQVCLHRHDPAAPVTRTSPPAPCRVRSLTTRPREPRGMRRLVRLSDVHALIRECMRSLSARWFVKVEFYSCTGVRTSVRTRISGICPVAPPHRHRTNPRPNPRPTPHPRPRRPRRRRRHRRTPPRPHPRPQPRLPTHRQTTRTHPQPQMTKPEPTNRGFSCRRCPETSQSGGCGIRTHDDGHPPYRFSRPAHSATMRTLQATWSPIVEDSNARAGAGAGR